MARWVRPLGGLLGAALAAAGLAGCAPNSETIAGTIMADPLKYEFYDCKQLETTLKTQALQEQKLHDLIAKAEQDTGGAFIATIAYKNDYLKVRADIKVLRDTQQRKGCITQTEHGGIGAVH